MRAPTMNWIGALFRRPDYNRIHDLFRHHDDPLRTQIVLQSGRIAAREVEVTNCKFYVETD